MVKRVFPPGGPPRVTQSVVPYVTNDGGSWKTSALVFGALIVLYLAAFGAILATVAHKSIHKPACVLEIKP